MTCSWSLEDQCYILCSVIVPYVMEIPSNLKLEMKFIVPSIQMYCNVGCVGNVDNSIGNIDIKGCPSKKEFC